MMTAEAKPKNLTDTRGRAWAHIDTCKAGDVLIADGGFTCIREGEKLVVQADPQREGVAALFVVCDDASHYLDGQLDFDGSGAFIGFYPADEH